MNKSNRPRGDPPLGGFILFLYPDNTPEEEFMSKRSGVP
jgi:hypothetical protein